MIAIKPTLPANINLLPPRTATFPLLAVKSTVLLVGSSSEELRKLGGYFGDTYRLFSANNAAAAMEIVNRNPIQLVVTNHFRNGINGSQLCARLKSSLRTLHIPVILIIDQNLALSKISCLRAGADALLENPLCREVLLAQVSNLLENRARLKRYYEGVDLAYTNIVQSTHTQAFTLQLNSFINENITNDCFSVDCLARYMNMSRPTLYRKVQSTLNITPNELINSARLTKAAELLSTSNYKVCEIAKLVGFSSRSNFGKAFIKKFNLTPSAYQQLKRGF